MIQVSIGIDGTTIVDDINLKEALRSGGSGHWYGSKVDPKSMVGNVIHELRSLDNKNITKSISLARNSTTPDNAAKKIRNIITTYKECMDLFHERSERMRLGEEDVRQIIREYFYSEKGKAGILPAEPIRICSDYAWVSVKKLNIPTMTKFPEVPRVLGIEVGKDFSIGDARLFSVEVTLGCSNNKGGAKEEFTEISNHTINFTMERLDDE